MANQAELDYIAAHGPYTNLRVLEIGSSHEFSARVRALVNAREYVSVDMRPHENTDIVHDLENPLDIEPFDVILCMSVMEHVRRPWIMAPNIENLLKPGGLLLLSVPFWWRVHAYPDDYYRYTPSGIKAIFEGINFHSIVPVPPKTDLTAHQVTKVMLLAEGEKP